MPRAAIVHQVAHEILKSPTANIYGIGVRPISSRLPCGLGTRDTIVRFGKAYHMPLPRQVPGAALSTLVRSRLESALEKERPPRRAIVQEYALHLAGKKAEQGRALIPVR